MSKSSDRRIIVVVHLGDSQTTGFDHLECFLGLTNNFKYIDNSRKNCIFFWFQNFQAAPSGLDAANIYRACG